MEIFMTVITWLIELLSERDKEIEQLKRENRTCPSYDCGFCETFPTPYSVKCGAKKRRIASG